MARGAVRGAAIAWLGLVTLDALVSSRGSQSVTGAMGVVTSVVNRALSPDVALIPDFRNGSPAPSTSTTAAGKAASSAATWTPTTVPIPGRPQPIPSN